MLCKVAHLIDHRPGKSPQLCSLPNVLLLKLGIHEVVDSLVLKISFLNCASDENSKEELTGGQKVGYGAEGGGEGVGGKEAGGEAIYSRISFFRWSGEISSTHQDCIEIYDTNAPNLEAMGLVEVMKVVPEALEVHVEPNSYYDWEIISSQAETLERLFLQQISLVSPGDRLQVKLSASLSVNIHVQRIILKNNKELTSSLSPSPSSSPSSSHKFNGSNVSSFFNRLIHPFSVLACAILEDFNSTTCYPVASVTRDALLIVAPYSASIERSHQRILDENCEELVLDEKEVLDLLHNVMSMHSLHVLPEYTRALDTSYDSSFSSGRFNHSDDGITCYLNPSQEAIARLILSQLKGNEKNLTLWYEKDFILLHLLTSKRWLVNVITQDNDDKHEGIEVRIALSTRCRPFHVLLPRAICNKFRLKQEDKVSLHLILEGSDDKRILHKEENESLCSFSSKIDGNIYTTPLLCANEFLCTVFRDLSTSLQPYGVWTRIVHGLPPPLGLLITGDSGTGKSHSLLAIVDLLKSCPDIMIDIETIDCKELRGRENVTPAAIDFIVNNCNKEGNARGRLILLDNLDYLCPYITDQETFARDPQGFTAIAYAAKRLEDLFEVIRKRNDHSHQRALLLFKDIFSHDNAGVRDLVVSHAMKEYVFIIATCKSVQTLHPRLMTLFNLRSSVSVPRLDAHARHTLLSSTISQLGYPFKDDLFTAVVAATEGLSPADITAAGAKIAMLAATRVRHHMSRGCTVAATTLIEDLHRALSPDSEFTQNSDLEAAEDSWRCIYGLSKAKAMILSVLQRPIIFRRLFEKCPIQMSKGILLVGPPGNGKTMLANAIAKKLRIPLLSVKGPTLLNKYIGASEKAVRDLFEKAKALGRPCLIFFDEFEAIAARR